MPRRKRSSRGASAQAHIEDDDATGTKRTRRVTRASAAAAVAAAPVASPRASPEEAEDDANHASVDGGGGDEDDAFSPVIVSVSGNVIGFVFDPSAPCGVGYVTDNTNVRRKPTSEPCSACV